MTEDPEGAAPENKMKEARHDRESPSEVERKRGHWLALGFNPLPVVVVSLLVIRGTPFPFISILFGYLLWASFCSLGMTMDTSGSRIDQPVSRMIPPATTTPIETAASASMCR